MKKKFFMCVLLLSATMVKAQELRWGITGGVNLSSPTNYNLQVGYNVGVKGEYLFKEDKGFYLDWGISLSKKGWKSEWYYDQQEKTSTQWKTNAHYLNIPIHVGYKIPAGEKFSFFASVGPYFGVGLFGKYKAVSDKSETTLAKNVFNDYMNRFDWGLGARLGVECMKHFQVSVGYDWGLKKIRHDKLNDSKNRNFNASVTYLF
ncbi:porin family protein [Bacteroides stercoris]|jgi:hypothetical protein|uniref:PorT family protein n=1 Tax=Bacteroides stercoris TaxID=46506 RepID=A0A412DLH8_BACSE|nr:porin family protein [Bacteroides stercoris]MDC2314861.1 porin family protein [Bacteroides stercoris]MDC2318072.1 porin family protein [Bacteroides stercoris]MDC2321179.1 porin family protein [Bacteroides stercoris]MDC2325248.1 porin family protein [Bacteroides stercoris]MDC2327520.1 porin family protein [Bacteroides stercoris]